MNQHKSIARLFASLGCGGTCFVSLFFTLIQCQITIGSKQPGTRPRCANSSAPSRPKTKSWDAHWPMAKTRFIERSARADGYAKPNERIWWI